MKSRTKIWVGIGAFALVQGAGLTLTDGNLPSLSIATPAQAADGTCGWEINSHGRWNYDENCERGERFVPSRSYYRNDGRSYHNYGYDRRQWNEQAERWEHGDRRYNERGNGWGHGDGGNDRWGERGHR